jgi:dipeptidyl aminopeptidase/acylaminoacyl peptidase
LNPGSDRSPLYSPDGKYLAYRSQARAGYESDKWRLVLFERATGRTTVLNESQDRNVEEMTWSPDSTRLFYVIEDRGRTVVETMAASGGSSRAVITGASHVGDVQFGPDGKTMVYSEQSGTRPAGLFRVSSGGGSAVQLDNVNAGLLNEHQLTPYEEVWVETPTTKHAFIALL